MSASPSVSTPSPASFPASPMQPGAGGAGGSFGAALNSSSSVSQLSMQQAVNEYVVAHNRGQYQVAVAALKESCQAAIGSKMPDVMKQLTMFRLDPSTFVSLLHLLKAEDLKVVRYAHYFILQVAEEMPEKAVEAISMLEKEARSENIGRRVFGLRTYAALCPYAGANMQLIMLLSQELDKVASTSADTKKKSLFSKKTTSTGETKGMQFYALLAAARSVPNLCKMGGLPIPHVCAGLVTENAIAVRHALALIMDLIDKDPQSVAREIQPLLDLKKINLTDTLAAVYFTQVCAKLAKNPLGRLNPTQTDEFYRALTRQVGRSSTRVFLESVHLLSKAGYARMAAQKTTEGRPLVPSIMERLCTKVLSEKSVPTQHAGCRALRSLAKAFVLDQAKNDVAQSEKNPVGDIINTYLRDLRTSPSLYLRIQTLLVHIWVTPAHSLDSIRKWLLSEVSDRNIPSRLLVDIFTNLYERTQVSQEFSSLLLEGSRDWFRAFPDKCDGATLVKAWKSVAANPALRGEVVKVTFEVLEASSAGKSCAHIADIHGSVITFLGEEMHILAELSSSNPQSLTGGLSIAYAIISRLQHAAMFSVQANRLMAVDALGRMSLRVGEPLRFALYERLFKMANIDDFGLKTAALPYLQLLDQKYASMEQRGEQQDAEWDKKAKIIVSSN